MLLSTVVARTMEWSNRSTELNAIKPAFDVTPSFSQQFCRVSRLSPFFSPSFFLVLWKVGSSKSNFRKNHQVSDKAFGLAVIFRFFDFFSLPTKGFTRFTRPSSENVVISIIGFVSEQFLRSLIFRNLNTQQSLTTMGSTMKFQTWTKR